MAVFVIASGEIFGTIDYRKIERFLVPEQNRVLFTRGHNPSEWTPHTR